MYSISVNIFCYKMMFFNELIQVLFSYNGKINEKLKRAYTLDTYNTYMQFMI